MEFRTKDNYWLLWETNCKHEQQVIFIPSQKIKKRKCLACQIDIGELAKKTVQKLSPTLCVCNRTTAKAYLKACLHNGTHGVRSDQLLSALNKRRQRDNT